jgi:di/tripeptidase
MNIVERFLKYTQFDTQSAEDSESVPSTEKQLAFAAYLKEELKSEGLEDVELDEQGYLYATLPANTKAEVPTIGFISHYDTSPDCSGANIRPRIVEHYDGGDIVLSEGTVSSPKMFPELLAHVGEDLIVTDGTTLLGADDKAGIAEIVQAMVWLKAHPEGAREVVAQRQCRTVVRQMNLITDAMRDQIGRLAALAGQKLDRLAREKAESDGGVPQWEEHTWGEIWELSGDGDRIGQDFGRGEKA